MWFKKKNKYKIQLNGDKVMHFTVVASNRNIAIVKCLNKLRWRRINFDYRSITIMKLT